MHCSAAHNTSDNTTTECNSIQLVALHKPPLQRPPEPLDSLHPACPLVSPSAGCPSQHPPPESVHWPLNPVKKGKYISHNLSLIIFEIMWEAKEQGRRCCDESKVNLVVTVFIIYIQQVQLLRFIDEWEPSWWLWSITQYKYGFFICVIISLICATLVAPMSIRSCSSWVGAGGAGRAYRPEREKKGKKMRDKMREKVTDRDSIQRLRIKERRHDSSIKQSHRSRLLWEYGKQCTERNEQ